MFRLEGGRPGDERGFIHKKLLGLASKVTSFIPGPIAGVVSGITGQLAGTGGRGGAVAVRPRLPSRAAPQLAMQDMRFRASRPVIPRTLTARPSAFSAAGKELGRKAKFNDDLGTAAFGIPDIGGVIRGIIGPGNGCDPPLIRSAEGNCIAPTSPRGAELFRGQPIVGQYGAGMVAGSKIIDRATCGRGMQLGNDGICYNKAQISNKQRMWPAGRKPLLSGGDMRAISTAARAGRRMELATKRLQKMGMMKKATVMRRAPRGHVARLEHASEH